MEYYNWPTRSNGSQSQSMPTQRPIAKRPAFAATDAVAEATQPVDLNDVDTQITNMFLFRTSIRYQTKEFFNNSTLHGVRYVYEKHRPFGERMMWFIFTMTGFIAALVIIASLWEKFQTNPTITGLDMDVHNTMIVFPMVVVCPIESFDMNHTNILAAELGKTAEGTEAFQPFLTYLPQLGFDTMKIAYEHSTNISSNKIYNETMSEQSLRRYAFEAATSCNETFDVCKYREEEIDCCENFHTVYSEHGFCFAFNPKYFDEPDAEIKNKEFFELYETDKKWSLFFTPKREAKIFVQAHSENFGWDFRPHVVWEPDFAAELLITMKQTYTTEDAKQLSIRQRRCIFPNEVKLQYYPGEYIFTNCMKECRQKKAIKLCGCLPPFYGPLDGVEYCRLKDMECLSTLLTNITNVRDCNKCELSCENIVYEIEKLSKTTADPSKSLDTYVNVEFLTWPMISYKREVLFGWVDLLVSFGGIAGLFLGFSLLSGIEILYYFSLRACCMLYRNRDQLYQLAELKLQEPVEFIDLTLTVVKRDAAYIPSNPDDNNDDDEDIPVFRRIDVAEISSHVDGEMPVNDASSENPIRMTVPRHVARFSRKPLTGQTMLQANRTTTSYDYAQATGPFYIP